jgi:hypothetical protein
MSVAALLTLALPHAQVVVGLVQCADALGFIGGRTGADVRTGS